ncbi:hypothetical protein OG589_24625 [Sphaerisporangium sp. NBC_01403]|uniref:hypothetical protein n=1 Tax=Sphaerisporangium sp. NBC_01403 TaxID=2903599 RepID=UPI00324868E0
MRIVGAEANRIYNEMHREWALTYQVDPAEDPEFLRLYRERIGQDPETGLYLDSDYHLGKRLISSSDDLTVSPPGTPRPTRRQLPDSSEEPHACTASDQTAAERIGPVDDEDGG